MLPSQINFKFSTICHKNWDGRRHAKFHKNPVTNMHVLSPSPQVKDILAAAKFIQPSLGDLPGALKARLGDSNKNLVSIQCVHVHTYMYMYMYMCTYMY